jgi:hypothetical protein
MHAGFSLKGLPVSFGRFPGTCAACYRTNVPKGLG